MEMVKLKLNETVLSPLLQFFQPFEKLISEISLEWIQCRLTKVKLEYSKECLNLTLNHKGYQSNTR
jgi:hypothetical protein